jgi:hypothetical protein
MTSWHLTSTSTSSLVHYKYDTYGHEGLVLRYIKVIKGNKITIYNAYKSIGPSV